MPHETDIAATAAAAPEVPGTVTPLMAQYLAIKRDNPDAILFYRMGDFYEMFFEDAVRAAAALDIALTKRGKHLGEDIPMCGVPVHAHEAYLARLIRKGFKVAVCEQLEDPAEARKRGGKAVVKRDTVRIVTPGTITEDSLLDARRSNWLAALAEAERSLGLAWLDVSTGGFVTQAIAAPAVAAALARIEPGEILIADRLLQRTDLAETLRDWRDRLSPLPASRFDSENGRRRLEALYGVGALDGFGGFSRAELSAAGTLVDYVNLTQRGHLPCIGRPRRLGTDGVMEMDAATRRNLELTESLSGDRRGCLLGVIDRTLTGAGARLLRARLAAPLTDAAAIDDRLDAVTYFAEFAHMREAVREALKACPDIERAMSRLGVGRGGPRDLAAVREGLRTAGALRETLGAARAEGQPKGIAEAAAELGDHASLVGEYDRALVPEPPLAARDGGFVAAGYETRLDELRMLRDESRRLVAELQDRYVRETGITTLKIRHNNLLGYHVEVPAKQAERMPAAVFIQRQGMANAVRYATVELGELENRIARAADQALALEAEIFERLWRTAQARAEEIAQAATALAALDVAAGLAEVAVERSYCRPVLDAGTGFAIEKGRHPVVEAALADAGQPAFVGNDCVLGDDSRLWLLTGPNMAGKSTFLRQNALIAILAQMGSYVPARSARLGIVDRLFSRVGAADDLARGRSTFMVEMVETAGILNQAGPRALVILDEIGRGTATFDGLSIAWAVVEHLAEVNRCRALFATHYHELTALAARLPAMACHGMRVKEWQGEVVFLHEVGPGSADRSYGIHVGRLAGLPPAVVARAEEVLATLEQGEQSSALTKLADDLPLFAAAVRKVEAAPMTLGPSPVEEALSALQPDELSPREALEALYRLKGMLK